MGVEETGAAARERIRELGNDAFRRRRFDEAVRMYTLALKADDEAPAAERASPAERAKDSHLVEEKNRRCDDGQPLHWPLRSSV